MKFFVEVGHLTTAGGGLSKLTAEEALILVREFQRQRRQTIRVFNAKSFAEVSLAELEQAARGKVRHAMGPLAPVQRLYHGEGRLPAAD